MSVATGPNPFQYGRELDASELADRVEELERILTTIRNRDRLFLIGPRRFGKTSLLAAAASRVDPDDVAVVRINAEAYESLAAFAAELSASAARALRTPLGQASEWAQSVLGRLRPKVTLGPGGIGIEFGLGVEAERVQTVVDALNAVDQLAATHAPRGLVVVIDEVQELILAEGLAAEKQLRSAVQTHRHTGYIFAGSATRMLHEMTTLAERPFYRMGARLFLGPIPRPEFAPFLARAFRTSDIAVSDAGITAMLDRARDVPYNVMRLAHEVWEGARSGALAVPVEPGAVDGALSRIVGQEAPAHATVWRSLTAAQKKTLKAVIEEEGQGLLSRTVSHRYGIASSSLQRALEALEGRQLIRQALGEEEPHYLLVDPFFAAWLREAQHADTESGAR